MEKLRELVLAYMTKTLGKSPEEVSSLLFTKGADDAEVVKDDALTALFDLDKSRVKVFEDKIKEQHDKGYSKAKAEELGKFEKEAREKYGITEDLKGLALLEAISAKAAKDSGTGEVTEDQVKRSKVYLDTLDQLKKEKEAAVTEWKTKYEGREKELQREATFKTVSDDALKFLDSLNPILPDDEEIAREWKNTFLGRLNEFEFEIKDGKKIVLKKEADGTTKALLDDHGHPVSFDDVVKQKASKLFKFKQGEARGGTGNKNEGAGGNAGKGYTGPVPKTEKEYQDLIAANAGNEDAQIAITKAYIPSK